MACLKARLCRTLGLSAHSAASSMVGARDGGTCTRVRAAVRMATQAVSSIETCADGHNPSNGKKTDQNSHSSTALDLCGSKRKPASGTRSPTTW